MLALALLLLPFFHARALGPHEVAVIANAESTNSVALARSYMKLRAIPDVNLVVVRVPRTKDGAFPVAVTREEFSSQIWAPATNALARTGLAGQCLAWVYSCDFPTRIAVGTNSLAQASTQDMSLCGLTFTHNVWPGAANGVTNAISAARVRSLLFAGPVKDDEPPMPAMAFDRARMIYLEAMPIPSFLLSWTGARGIGAAASLASLTRSAKADCSAPKGTVWFQLQDDIRSSTRAPQYEGAIVDIETHEGVKAVVSTNAPAASDGPIIGFMTGARTVVPPATLVPGVAYCDNLTSFAAAFDNLSGHTKVTEWLAKGAAFSAGEVTEPYAIAAKFPNAWIFARMLDGYTAIEALYASVASPFQILPVGDPLARPWAPLVEPELRGPASSIVSGLVEFSVTVPKAPPRSGISYQWLVDGVVQGVGRSFLWDTTTLRDGVHSVRVVARYAQPACHPQGFAEFAYRVDNRPKPKSLF